MRLPRRCRLGRLPGEGWRQASDGTAWTRYAPPSRRSDRARGEPAVTAARSIRDATERGGGRDGTETLWPPPSSAKASTTSLARSPVAPSLSRSNGSSNSRSPRSSSKPATALCSSSSTSTATASPTSSPASRLATRGSRSSSPTHAATPKTGPTASSRPRSRTKTKRTDGWQPKRNSRFPTPSGCDGAFLGQSGAQSAATRRQVAGREETVRQADSVADRARLEQFAGRDYDPD
jgi:hypothetical protein